MFVLPPSISETKRRGWKIAQYPDVNGVMLGLAVEASLLAMRNPSSSVKPFCKQVEVTVVTVIMSPGNSGNRNGKRNTVTRSPQTSTQLATKKQSRLTFKKQKEPIYNVRRADVDPSKLMYQSNISGQPKHVDTTELEIVEHKAGIEDLTIDFAHGNVHSTVEGRCSPQNEQPADGNINVGAAVIGMGGCEHANAATMWDGGHNGIQVHFTDIKNLVQQNSIHGNVINAYAAMLTEMRKTVSGRAEFVGTTYVYTSKECVVEHHNKFVKPRVTAEGIGADLFDGTFVSVVDCPQQDPESSDCGIFTCFIIRQFICGAEVDTTMDGLTPTGLRAAMVDMFLSDPGRGLRGRTLHGRPFIIDFLRRSPCPLIGSADFVAHFDFDDDDDTDLNQSLVLALWEWTVGVKASSDELLRKFAEVGSGSKDKATAKKELSQLAKRRRYHRKKITGENDDDDEQYCESPSTSSLSRRASLVERKSLLPAVAASTPPGCRLR
ncbi:hypothetical protein LOK49_LG02G01619 [Camellia lanceoleosa]|uniref:Uncharacterized protein n=1 Tax=Camellia lanceoleosa TaxID=1840588 RepID=A0ACC0IIK0_9ERIC|nr:hypothetical protein LOK49_LG02G01619 [Camellia lanceoleosa]